MIQMSHCTKWFEKAQFYHIYPMGFCGAPQSNDFCSPAQNRLSLLYGWTDHILSLGADAIYLGPVFESSSHGYDTVDYYHVDRRLGNNASFKELVHYLKGRGIKVVLDAVFNHTGRDFWAFRDILQKGQSSEYTGWYNGLDFGMRSPYGDNFSYESWNGHYSLAKLNLHNPEVRRHLFDAVAYWMDEFGIDGLRLDAADCLDMDFLSELSRFCKAKRGDFFLLGEVIHGDYRRWIHEGGLDSVTNYECYKGLYSSLADKNYFEIAYSLNRQFGEGGIYRNMPLYAFADNHDVNRVTENLKRAEHLYPLYCMLYTMPGLPSVYYGSEWGIQGRKTNGSDAPLRPHLELASIHQRASHKALPAVISRLAQMRKDSMALSLGSYRQLYVSHQQMAYLREYQGEKIIIVMNSSEEKENLTLTLPGGIGGKFVDILNGGEPLVSENSRLSINDLYPNWCRVLRAMD